MDSSEILLCSLLGSSSGGTDGLPSVGLLSDAPSATPSGSPADELRGLSVFEDVPGILDLIDPLRDRADSLVSDLLNEGYESSDGPPFSEEAPSCLSFEGWLPIALARMTRYILS